jgi:glycopeptide antibiotics resistance protein
MHFERGGVPFWRRVSFLRYCLGGGGLLIVAVLVGLMTLTPTPVDQGRVELIKQLLSWLHDHGVPQWFGYHKLEFTANIVMFVPLGFFIALLLPLRSAWLGGVVGMLASMFVELTQLFALPGRVASVLDVLANSVGGWVGVGIAVLLRLAVASRDRALLRREHASASAGV